MRRWGSRPQTAARPCWQWRSRRPAPAACGCGSCSFAVSAESGGPARPHGLHLPRTPGISAAQWPSASSNHAPGAVPWSLMSLWPTVGHMACLRLFGVGRLFVRAKKSMIFCHSASSKASVSPTPRPRSPSSDRPRWGRDRPKRRAGRCGFSPAKPAPSGGRGYRR